MSHTVIIIKLSFVLPPNLCNLTSAPSTEMFYWKRHSNCWVNWPIFGYNYFPSHSQLWAQLTSHCFQNLSPSWISFPDSILFSSFSLTHLTLTFKYKILTMLQCSSGFFISFSPFLFHRRDQ